VKVVILQVKLSNFHKIGQYGEEIGKIINKIFFTLSVLTPSPLLRSKTFSNNFAVKLPICVYEAYYYHGIGLTSLSLHNTSRDKVVFRN